MAQVELLNLKYKKLIDTLESGELIEKAELKKFIFAVNYSDPDTCTKWEDYDLAQQKAYLLNTRFPQITCQAPIQVSEPQPDARPAPITHSLGAAQEASLASVLKYLTKSSDDQSALTDVILQLTPLWGAERLRLALSGIVSQMSAFPPVQSMGVPAVIDTKTYAAWKDLNKQDVHYMGPMLLYKCLHQMGVKWKVYRKMGDNYIKFTRNRISVYSFTKYIMDGLSDNQKEAAQEMRTMLEGLKYKGKQIEYFPISYKVYKFIDYINAQYDISTNKIIEMAPRTRPTMIHDELTDKVEQVVAKVKKDKIPAKDADIAIDKLAQILSSMFTQEALDAIDDILGDIDLTLDGDLKYYLTVLDEMASVSVNRRLQTIEERFNAKCTVEEACKHLDLSRAERNRTRVSQYLNKNIGSVMGDHLPQFVDTYSKAQHIVDHMTEMDILPTKEDKVIVTGIAYGHMLPVIEKLVPLDNVRYYDIERAKGSSANFEPGNVYKVDAKDQYLFDDTNTLKIKEKTRIIYGGEKADKGDHVKIMRVAQLPPKVAYVKLTMYSFETPEYRKRYENILFPNGQKQVFRYVRCFKFGKLHNDEFYMVLSNLDTLPETTWSSVIGDLRTISASMIMANTFIDMAERYSVRLCDPTRSEATTASTLWTKLVKALPGRWRWYTHAPTEDNPYTAGNEMAGVVNLEVINEFEAATYADAGDDGIPDWESGPFDDVRKTGGDTQNPDSPSTQPLPNKLSWNDMTPEPKFVVAARNQLPDDLYPPEDPSVTLPPPKFSQLAKVTKEKPPAKGKTRVPTKK